MSRATIVVLNSTLLLNIGLGVAGASTARAETHKIGTHGATLELETPWIRTVINKDLGTDQFRLKTKFLSQTREIALVVLEFPELVESEEDAARFLKKATLPAASKPDFTLDPVTTSSSTDRWIASQQAQSIIGGMNMSVRYVLVARDGLAYVLILTALSGHAALIEKHADSIVESLKFPGPGSEWHERTKPVSKTLAVGDDLEVSFSYRPSVFEPTDSGDSWLLDLSSPDEDCSILVGERLDYEDAEAVLDADISSLREASSRFEIRSRGEDWVGGMLGHRLVATVGDQTVTCLVLRPSGDRFLEFRHIALGGPELPRRDRDLLWESLRARRLEPVDAYPVVAQEDAPSPPMDPHLVEVLKGSRLVGDSGLSYVRQALRFGDVLLLTDGYEVRWLEPGLPCAEIVYRDAESYSEWTLALTGLGILLGGAGDELLWIHHGVTEPSGIRAHDVASLGSGSLVLTRSVTPTDFLGVGRLSWVDGDRLVVQRPDGNERDLAEIDGRILEFSANDDGSAVLAAADPMVSSPQGAFCLEILLVEEGARRRHEGWSSVGHVTPAQGGWLVTGRRAGSSPGVYLVTEEDDPSLLLAGSGFVGVSLRNGRLTYLTRDRLPGGDSGTGSFLVFEAPLNLVKEHGPLVLPFSAGVLNRLGTEALRSLRDRWPPRDAETVREIVSKARELADRDVGRPLPTEAVALDRLVSEVYPYATDLRAEAELLLGTLLAASWLDQGAEWVLGEASGEYGYWLPRLVPERSNSLVMARSPYAVMASTLHDPEGYWEPAQTIPRQAQGRRILIGVDRDALARAVQSAPPPDLAFLVREPNADATMELLRSAPRNEYLRELVYLHLAQGSQYEVVVRVSAKILEGPDATALDRRAWLGARAQVACVESASEDLVEDLFAAIREAPDDASLYAYLAQAYEVQGEDQRKVRACLRKALELQSRGTVADFATRRLEALDQEGPQTRTEATTDE